MDQPGTRLAGIHLDLDQVNPAEAPCAPLVSGEAAGRTLPSLQGFRPEAMPRHACGGPSLWGAPAGLDLDDDRDFAVRPDQIQLALRSSQVAMSDSPPEVEEGPSGQLLADPAEVCGAE